MGKLPFFAALALAVAGFTATAQATVIVYDANLDGPSESPANASPGTGFAVVTVDTVLQTMRVQANFSGLTGTTTASHIHAATALPGTGTAGVATTTPTFLGFPLAVTAGSYDNTLDMTQASSYNPSFVTANGGTALSAEAALFASLANDTAYFNIHTQQFPGGEIRGFLTPAPEPATLGLLGGAMVLVMMRRRRGNRE